MDQARELIDGYFKSLCDPDDPRPLPRFGAMAWEGMRSWLSVSGGNLSISQEAFASLSRKQFRTIDDPDGRGPGMVEVLGRRERVEELLKFCFESQEGMSTKIVSSKTGEPIEGSEGRGCQQFAADLLTFALTGSRHYLDAINRRVWKGHLKSCDDKTRLLINKTFTDAGVPEPTKKTASVSPESIWAVWLFLTNRIS